MNVPWSPASAADVHRVESAKRREALDLLRHSELLHAPEEARAVELPRADGERTADQQAVVLDRALEALAEVEVPGVMALTQFMSVWVPW